MFTRHTLIILAVLGLSVVCFAATSDVPVGANLLKNPGFEKGASGWQIDPTKWQVVSDIAYSGNQSLRISNNDAASYTLASSPVPCVPDRVYRITARIKTDNVEGAESGATVCLEWYNKWGEFLGGWYPPGIKGTNDWTLLTSDSKLTPADAASMRAVVYLRKGCTGAAWFDDVSVEITDEPGDLTFRPLVRYPNYRATIFPWQPRRLDVGAEVKTNRAHSVADLSLEVSVVDASNKIIATGRDDRILGKPWANARIDLSNAGAGEYRAVATLFDMRKRAELGREVFRFRIAEDATPRPKVYIDEHNRCVVDGELFFPLGMYIGESPASPNAVKDLEKFSESRFNCMMMYGINNGTPDQIRTYLDLVNRFGRKLIYSVKDVYPGSVWETKQVGEWAGIDQILRGVVTTFKDHPAVLAWYLNDELSGDRLPQIADHYEKIKSMDPNHPMWQVLYLGQKTADHVSSTDALGIDNYPVPAAPITNFYLATADVKRAVLGARAMWMVPQGSSQGAYRGDPTVRHPTFEETMCMSYLGLIHGAGGLVYYSFFDLKRTNNGDAHWEVLKRVADEMQRIKHIVLGIDAPDGKSVKVSDERIHVLTREVDGEILVLAANPHKESVKAVFRIGPDTGATGVEATASARLTDVTRNSFADEIEPYGVRVYKLTGR